MYNFLKYKRNWKKCPYCGGKMERMKERFGDSYKCIDYCGKDYPKEFLIRVPSKTKVYYFFRKIMRNLKKLIKMSICYDCKKKIIPDKDLIDFDEDGYAYHWKCLNNKKSCEAEEAEL